MNPPDQVMARLHSLELDVVLLATAALYLWNLGASDWANPFYSAEVQAGSQNRTACYGSGRLQRY